MDRKMRKVAANTGLEKAVVLYPAETFRVN